MLALALSNAYMSDNLYSFEYVQTSWRMEIFHVCAAGNFLKGRFFTVVRKYFLNFSAHIILSKI